jgi:ER membrane protein complex subunit 3
MFSLLLNLQLELDSRIRDWVLFPILITMFLFGVIRNYVTIIFSPSSNSKVKNVDKFRHGQTLKRSNDLKLNHRFIPKESFKRRRHFFFNEEKIEEEEGKEPRKGTGLLNEVIPSQTLSSMTDPSQVGDLMKNNMAMILPNMIIFGWLSYFYSSKKKKFIDSLRFCDG